MKKARVNRAQYHNRQLLNQQTLTRSKFFFVLFFLLGPFSAKRCASFAISRCISLGPTTTPRVAHNPRANRGAARQVAFDL
jgi:hypothetical protein